MYSDLSGPTDRLLRYIKTYLYYSPAFRRFGREVIPTARGFQREVRSETAHDESGLSTHRNSPGKFAVDTVPRWVMHSVAVKLFEHLSASFFTSYVCFR